MSTNTPAQKALFVAIYFHEDNESYAIEFRRDALVDWFAAEMTGTIVYVGTQEDLENALKTDDDDYNEDTFVEAANVALNSWGPEGQPTRYKTKEALELDKDQLRAELNAKTR